MSKLSKTAKASMVQTVSKAKVEWTPENAIPEIRRSREAKLFVGNMELVDVLLAEYDRLVGVVLGDINTKAQYAQRIETLQDDLKTLATMSAQNRATVTVLREGKQAADADVARLTETVKQLTLERDEARAQLEQEHDVRLLLSSENAKLAKETGDVVSSIHEAEATMMDAGLHKA